ncbi:hypothetical protein [Nocardia salmonicida]|uniref:hypothetical protein n=1 Tax=Nocardia salmonicida TaxID=53431 RepID=UPI000AA3ECF3|nr:hypothetical protein [Nocardia salmonicida]
MGYPYGPQQGQGYPPAGQQGYNPHGGQGAPGYGTPGPGAPAFGAPNHGAPGLTAPGFGGHGYGTPAPGAPGYGGPGHNGPGYGAPRGPVNGTTGIIAAVVAALLSLVSVVGAAIVYNSPAAIDYRAGKFVMDPDGTFSNTSDAFIPTAIGYMVVCVVVSVLLLTGSILLFLRTTAGRVIAIVAGALSVLVGAGSFAPDLVSPAHINGAMIGMVQPVLSLVLLALAIAPSTGRWIQASRRRPSYPQGNYQRY